MRSNVVLAGALVLTLGAVLTTGHTGTRPAAPRPAAAFHPTFLYESLWSLAGVAVLESVPLTVKVKLPAAVGVPETRPALDRARPGGSAPLAGVVLNVYGAAPPLAVSDWL